LSYDVQDDLRLIRTCVEREKQNNGPSPFKNSIQRGEQNYESSPKKTKRGKQNYESSPKKTPSVCSAPEIKPDVQYGKDLYLM
jgi:hypothetical protein